MSTSKNFKDVDEIKVDNLSTFLLVALASPTYEEQVSASRSDAGERDKSHSRTTNRCCRRRDAEERVRILEADIAFRDP